VAGYDASSSRAAEIVRHVGRGACPEHKATLARPARPDRVGYADADAETSAPDIPRLTKAFREAELMKAIAGVS